MLILDVQLFGRRRTDPTAAFLHGFREKHDCSETVFLADSFGYRTVFSRLGVNGRVDYTERNLIEKWFHTLTMRVDRFHNSWVGSQIARSIDEKLCIVDIVFLRETMEERRRGVSPAAAEYVDFEWQP